MVGPHSWGFATSEKEQKRLQSNYRIKKTSAIPNHIKTTHVEKWGGSAAVDGNLKSCAVKTIDTQSIINNS